MKYIYAISIIILSFFTSSCSLEHSLKHNDEASYSKKLPATYLRVHPINEFVTYHNLIFIDGFINELRKRDVFTELTDTPGPQYSLDIKYNGVDKRSGLQKTWWLLTALTLFIVPSQVDEQITMNVDIYNNNTLIKQYMYKDNITGWRNLFISRNSHQNNIHNTFINRLLYDIKSDNIFIDGIHI